MPRVIQTLGIYPWTKQTKVLLLWDLHYFLLFSQVTLILFFWGDDYSQFQYSTLETWTLFFLWISCPCFHVSYLINLDFIFALASLLCICRDILLCVNLIHISCTFLSLPLSFFFLPLSFNTHFPGVSSSIS